MSWELCACLDHFGLEERWLKILKNLEIETIETLEARGEDADLYNVLEKAANDEEKEALPLLFSNDCKDFVEQMRVFAGHLQENGLQPSKWQRIFAEEGILTLQDLHKFSGNLKKFDILNCDVKEETIALQQVMDISSDVAGEHEVEVFLDKIGLDSKYWFSIFKNELHMVHPALLKYFTSTDCQILMAKTRHENEVSVVKKHFITENDQSFAIRWQRDEETLKKYSAEGERLLFELEKGLAMQQRTVAENETQLEEEEISEDLKIRSTKEYLCSLLQIPRMELAEHSVSPTSTIKMLKQQIEELKLQEETNADVSVENILEKTSDGLLLRGMYFADEDEKLVPRRKVFKPPSEPSLTEPTMYYRNVTEKFSSEKAQEKFSLSLRNIGYSMTVAERAENENLQTGNKSVQSDLSCQEESNYIQVRYIVIPVAKANIDTKHLLMEDILEELKNIEDEDKALPKSELLNKCYEFFNTHGTHTNTGQVHFGGICELRVKYSGNFQNNPEVLDKVIEEAMEEMMKLGWKHRNSNFSAFDLSESLKEKYTMFDFENLSLCFETVGGPPHASSFFQWKLGLAGTSSSLAVIDRGFQVKGIWEILDHYGDHFQCYQTVATLLLSAWESKTGLKTAVLPNRRYLVEIPQRVSELCQFIKNCITSTDFPENCEQYLIYINNERDELALISRQPNLWCSIVKENHCIQTFLNTVMENMTKFSKNSIQAIQFLFANLIDDIENSDFISRDAIVQWSKDCESQAGVPVLGVLSILNNFVSTVRKFVIPRLKEVCINNNKNGQALHDGHIICITHDFLIYASSVSDKLHKLGEYHAFYLLQLLLFCIGYDIGNGSCNRLLSEADLNKFLQGLEDKVKILVKYSSQCLVKAECYLLSVVLEIARERHTNLDSDEKISLIINPMKPNFTMKVRKLIDECGNSPSYVNNLQSSVQSVVYGTGHESENHKLLGTGLEKVMKAKSVLPMPCEVPAVQMGTPKVASHVERKQGESVLELLGLLEYFPSKITLEHVKQTPQDKLETIHDIPWYVLQKLLLLDYRGRDASCSSQDNVQKTHEQENTDCDVLESLDEDFIDNIFAGVNLKTEGSCTKMPNPVDVLVALFLCSSNFLRQVLAEKMFMCQLSIPILLPDRDNGTLTYLVWALRTLICEYELPDGSIIETPLVSHKLPTVSFLRLGKVSRSKSKLLNDIIGNQGHNTFFHRDCANGIMHPVLADGLADIAWFLPSKKVKSRINDAVTYINLHGDAKCFPKQCYFLVSLSDIMVVMVSTVELEHQSTAPFLNEIITSNKKLVLIITKTQDKSTDNFKQSFAKCLKAVGQGLRKQTIILDFDNNGNKTASAVSSETLDGIFKALPHGNASSLEESIEYAINLGFLVDERDHECAFGKLLAEEVFNIIDDNVVVVKSEMLPLQGDLWHQWGIVEKKEHRGNGRALSEHYAASLHEEKKALRHKQLLICNNPPRLLESFISKLLRTPGTMKLYFLKWLAVFLDGTSRRTLPSLMKEYRMKWNEINQRKCKQNNVADSYMMKLQDDLCKIEENLALSSLGLEHMMREVGQAYEAVASLTDRVGHGLQKNIHKLPRVMAELILLGHPLEIMDGDSSHVPLLWVTAVLTELKNIIGDKKLFVLSVLGIQSSGKSTLLNTMFGLQFTVSAGRCTRGVYAQLVPIPERDPHLLCDYILVLDTEGLRAPELGATKHQHDNELATLVIGLGDMTIINIKGENPTEMQDVLQIVVHALLRMRIVNKNLKLQPSCFFIHQNVGALNAAEKMMFGQQKLLENLDQMTAAAADQENAKGINSFKEVIDFNVEKNVWYFSDLWQGDPPMAPANPGYSEKVCEVKMSVLHEMRKRSPTSLSSICIRIKDLWKGVLAENFVFSFKNSLELRAYGSLESTLTDLSWSLQNDALKWLNGARNRILSSEKELDTLENSLSCEFCTYFNEVYEKSQNKLANFFENNDDKAIVEQWKVKSMIKLEDRKEDAGRTTMTSLRNDIKVRKAELDQISKTKMYKDEIQGLAKKLALELQDKRNIAEREIEKHFNLLWSDWMKSLSEKQLRCYAYNIKVITEEKLYEMLPDLSLHLGEELKRAYRSSPIKRLCGNFEVCTEHIINKKKLFFFDKLSPEKCLQQAYDLVNDLFDDIDDYLKSLQGSNFNPSQVVTVIKKTCDMVEGVNTNSNRAFKFDSLFKVQLVIFVSQYSVFKFQKLQDDYLREIDPKTAVERNYKEQLLKFFKSKYLANKNEKIVADMLSTCLMDAVNKAVLGDMARELANDVRQNVLCLHTKGDLLNAVLRDMLKLGKFEEYYFYLRNVKKCLRKWIKTYTDKYVFDEERNGTSRYSELASLKIQLHFNNIRMEMDKVDALLKHDQEVNKKNFQLWLKMFHEGIKDKLPLPESNLSLFAKEYIEDEKFYKEVLLKNLDSAKNALEDKAKSVGKRDIQSQNTSVYLLLERECLGCCQQCPFCRAPCSLTIPGHEVQHSALQHYPQGAGTYRFVNNQKLVIENCSTLVSGNATFLNRDTEEKVIPYKEYSKFYPDWNIQGDASMEASLYWKWFMANFATQLARVYRAVVPDIPHAWTLITPAEAEASLN